MGSELRIRGSLVLRLIAWFLFLSTVPLAVMAVFVRRNVTQAFIAHAERRYKQQVEMLALHISQLPEEQSQLELLAALTNNNQQAYIISPDGKYLLNPLPERVGKPISDQYSPETVARMLSGDSTFSTDDLSNEFISTLRIPEREQILVFTVSQELVRRDLAELESSSFVQLGVSLLLISLIGGAAIWAVVGVPIRNLTQAARRLGGGDFSFRVDPEDMEDELELLALSFNRMASQIQSLVGGLETTVADLRKAENNLQASEWRFRAMIENSADGIALLDSDGGLIYSSGTVLALLGYSPDELSDKKIFEYIHPDDREAAIDDLARLAQTPGGYADRELRFRHRDGTYRWLEVTASNSLVDPSIGGFVLNYRDVTARKQAERDRERLILQVREHAQQVQQIMDTVPDGLLLLDSNRRIRLVNPVAASYLPAISAIADGEPLEYLGNRPLGELLIAPPEGVWHEILHGDQIYEVAARPIGSPEQPEGWVVVLRDATQERDIQRRVQQQERLAAVGQLAAGIAHDFNNIMAVILLYAEMMLSEPSAPPEMRERLRTVLQQAHRAADLIQQILDFSRRSILERTPVNLVPLFRDQEKLLRRTLPENIILDFQYGAEALNVNADLTRIQQVIMNLAFNARDAMPEGGTLKVTLSSLPAGEPVRCILCGILTGGRWLKVEFRDTGAGILAHLLARIFEPFFTTKGPGHGTGLGLSQVYGIVKQHEGHIYVENCEGGGACFSIYLPLAAEKSSASLQSAVLLTEGSGQTILVVEDDAITRRALLDGLNLLTYRSIPAANGVEALAILEEFSDKISLVLTDVVMPEMGGLALFEEIRRRGISVPVIMLTGHPMHQQLERLKERGLRSWMQKPVSLQHLAREISMVLEQ